MLLNLLRDIVNNVPSESYISLFIFLVIFVGGISSFFLAVDYFRTLFSNR